MGKRKTRTRKGAASPRHAFHGIAGEKREKSKNGGENGSKKSNFTAKITLSAIKKGRSAESPKPRGGESRLKKSIFTAKM
jgi:hypothetical protein